MNLPKKECREVGDGRVIAQYSCNVWADSIVFDEMSRKYVDIAEKAFLDDDGYPCFGNRFKAMATVDSADTYVYEKGRDLASVKCDLKLHRAIVKRCEIAIRKLERTIGELRAVQRRHLAKVYNIENDIDRYYRGEKV